MPMTNFISSKFNKFITAEVNDYATIFIKANAASLNF